MTLNHIEIICRILCVFSIHNILVEEVLHSSREVICNRYACGDSGCYEGVSAAIYSSSDAGIPQDDARGG